MKNILISAVVLAMLSGCNAVKSPLSSNLLTINPDNVVVQNVPDTQKANNSWMQWQITDARFSQSMEYRWGHYETVFISALDNKKALNIKVKIRVNMYGVEPSSWVELLTVNDKTIAKAQYKEIGASLNNAWLNRNVKAELFMMAVNALK